MITVTLARKPPRSTIQAQCMDTGTGALNIGACRVGTSGGGAQCSYWPEPCGGHTSLRSQNTPTLHNNNAPRLEGRYPANLIVVHRAGCVPLPPEVEKYQINRWSDGQKPFGGGAGHPYEGAEAGALVERWSCVEGCPARAFDRPEVFMQVQDTDTSPE